MALGLGLGQGLGWVQGWERVRGLGMGWGRAAVTHTLWRENMSVGNAARWQQWTPELVVAQPRVVGHCDRASRALVLLPS